MEGENTPVDLVICRASSIPEFVYTEGTETQAGITGSDILWEAGKKDDGTELSTIKTGSKLFLGVNQDFKERFEAVAGRGIQREDFEGSMIVTKFPKITEEVFDGINVDIKEVRGSTEAVQYIYPNCSGIVDVIASGATVKANNIEVVSFILDPVTTRMVEKPDLSSKQERILADFREPLL
jgi:ATP phosphoribosyltransferase